MPWFTESAPSIPRSRVEAARCSGRSTRPRAAFARRRSACCCCRRILRGCTRARAGSRSASTSCCKDEADVHVIPTLGQHEPHTREQNAQMFGSIPHERIHPHDWRGGCTYLGDIPADYVKEITGGAADWKFPVWLNSMLMKEQWDLVINIGHVVPHEVLGFANHNKNYFIGLGGKELICASHMAAACCGIENNLGNLLTPVRQCFNWAEEKFLGKLPDFYVQVVLARDERGQLVAHRRLRRRRSGDVSRRRPPGPRAEHHGARRAAEEGRLRHARRRVLQHLGRQQGRLSHADGPGRRRRAGHHRPGPQALRRAAGGGCPHPQVRLLRHAARDGALQAKRRHAGPGPRHGPPDSRLQRRPLPHHLRPRPPDQGRHRASQFRLRRPGRHAPPLSDRSSCSEGFNDIDGERIYFIPTPSAGLWATRNKLLGRSSGFGTE